MLIVYIKKVAVKNHPKILRVILESLVKLSLHHKLKIVPVYTTRSAPQVLEFQSNGLGYLGWSGDGEAFQLEK
jgi:hypothetical protein